MIGDNTIFLNEFYASEILIPPMFRRKKCGPKYEKLFPAYSYEFYVGTRRFFLQVTFSGLIVGTTVNGALLKYVFICHHVWRRVTSFQK